MESLYFGKDCGSVEKQEDQQRKRNIGGARISCKGYHLTSANFRE